LRAPRAGHKPALFHFRLLRFRQGIAVVYSAARKKMCAHLKLTYLLLLT